MTKTAERLNENDTSAMLEETPSLIQEDDDDDDNDRIVLFCSYSP